MVILSDCLSERTDEGCLKVANNLIMRIKKKKPESTIVSYNCYSSRSDIHLSLNKLFLNCSLFLLIWKKKEPLLYIPFASNTRASAIRTWVLSKVSGKKVQVLFALRHPMKPLTSFFLRRSKADIVVLSKESYEYYCQNFKNKVVYLKTGVDTRKFVPVNLKRKQELRKKYDISLDEKVLLHIGHLNRNRNIDKLVWIDSKYHVFLILSSVTKKERDEEIRSILNECENITLIDFYFEHIEEIYQLADEYIFLAQKSESCIDIPLSVMEAAACNIPIVCTEYGELKAFRGEKGFYFLPFVEKKRLNYAIDRMLEVTDCNNREAVAIYDWDYAVAQLIES